MGSWRNPEILEVCGRVFTRFQEVTRFPALAASYTFSRAKLPLLRRFYSRLPMVTGFSRLPRVTSFSPLTTRSRFSRAFHPFKVSHAYKLPVTYFPALATHFMLSCACNLLHAVLPFATRYMWSCTCHLSHVFPPLPPVKALTKQKKEGTKVCHTLLFFPRFPPVTCFSAFAAR